LDCGGKVLRDAALFSIRSEKSGVAEYLAAAVQIISMSNNEFGQHQGIA
jgi:hypothetical protein